MRGLTAASLAFVLAAVSPAGGLVVGETVEGELGEGDAVDDAGRWRDVFALGLEADQSAVIDLRSGDFDTYLTITLPSGQRLEDDDSGGWLDSRLVITARKTGSAEVTVTPFEPGPGGHYSLSVSALEISQVGLGETVSAELEWEEALLTLPVREGEAVAIDVVSEVFDTTVGLRGPDGTSLFDDDGGEMKNSRLIYVPRASGEALVTVGSFDERTGVFRVSVKRTEALALEVGESVTGSVGGRPTLAVLSLSEGQHVALALTAERPDLAFAIAGPEGHQQESIAELGRRNPKMIHEAFTAGQAIITVTAAGGEGAAWSGREPRSEQAPLDPVAPAGQEPRVRFTLAAWEVDPVVAGKYGEEFP